MKTLFTPIAIALFVLSLQAPGLANGKKPMKSQNKTPYKPLQGVRGPAVHPAGPLLSFLKKVGDSRRLRLPVVIQRQTSFPYSVKVAFIGVGGSPAKDAIHVKISDLRMGSPLSSYLDRTCGKRKPTCVVWIEGYWGETLKLPSGPNPVKGPKRWPFALSWVHSLVDKNAKATTTYVLVEGTK